MYAPSAARAIPRSPRLEGRREESRYICAMNAERDSLRISASLHILPGTTYPLGEIFIEDTMQGKTLDESAEKLGIFHSTAWSWRQKIMDKLRSFQDDVVLSDKCELDEKYFR